jgi:hypothetical protein
VKAVSPDSRLGREEAEGAVVRPGVNRDEVDAAEEVLRLPLDEFIAVASAGLQQAAPEIGL